MACSDDSFFFKGQFKSPILHTHNGWVSVPSSLTFALYVILGGGLQLWVGWEEGKEESQGGSLPVSFSITVILFLIQNCKNVP